MSDPALHAVPTEGTDRPILPRSDLSWLRQLVRRGLSDLAHLEGRIPEEEREVLAKHFRALEGDLTNLLDDDGSDGA